MQKYAATLKQPLTDGMIVEGTLENEEVIFLENGLRFAANVIQGHKTGFFLDHRHNRIRISELSANKSVLDVFAFAGGFSVHALAGGATDVTSLDISPQALRMASENVKRNFPNAAHTIICADAFKGLDKLFQDGKKYNLIIIDPPSFAKSENEKEKALLSYRKLAQLAIPLLQFKGILMFASCSSRVSETDFFNCITDVASQSNKSFHIMETHTHDIDHPITFTEGAYLKAIYLLFD